MLSLFIADKQPHETKVASYSISHQFTLFIFNVEGWPYEIEEIPSA
jgi:hypothetical protein